MRRFVNAAPAARRADAFAFSLLLSQPNLVASAPSAPVSASAGSLINVSFLVTNSGNLAATAPFTDRLVLSQSGVLRAADTLTLQLERTEDILGSVRSQFAFTGFLVGFAAETENLIAHAQDKLFRKGCDLIIANDVSQPGIGFDSPENAVTLCFPDGQTTALPQQSKTALARELIQTITSAIQHRASSS